MGERAWQLIYVACTQQETDNVFGSGYKRIGPSQESYLQINTASVYGCRLLPHVQGMCTSLYLIFIPRNALSLWSSKTGLVCPRVSPLGPVGECHSQSAGQVL